MNLCSYLNIRRFLSNFCYNLDFGQRILFTFIQLANFKKVKYRNMKFGKINESMNMINLILFCGNLRRLYFILLTIVKLILQNAQWTNKILLDFPEFQLAGFHFSIVFQNNFYCAPSKTENSTLVLHNKTNLKRLVKSDFDPLRFYVDDDRNVHKIYCSVEQDNNFKNVYWKRLMKAL